MPASRFKESKKTASPLVGAFLIGASMLLAVAGLMLVRRHIDIDRLKRHHDVASYFISYDWDALRGADSVCHLRGLEQLQRCRH